MVAIRLGLVEVGVRLLGAAEANQVAMRVPASPMLRRAYAWAVKTGHLVLGASRYATAWEAGSAWSIDEALEEAMDLSLAGPVPVRPPSPFGLSRRELEVLQLVAEGRTDQQIANTLSISYRTATTHVTRVLNKLGVDSRTAAASLAVREGVV